MKQAEYAAASPGWWVANGQGIDRMGLWQFDEDGVSPTTKSRDGMFMASQPSDAVFEMRGTARQIAGAAHLLRLLATVDEADPDEVERLRRRVLEEVGE
ncbi:hypothetical protein ABZ714_12510 [Streptomyces sp. NPDC006798]|uniref:hypothetical protein n=1 Tax=Streptomyces sp. NPDC006798 TaxID=3155462 RepID=UPI0033F94017